MSADTILNTAINPYQIVRLSRGNIKDLAVLHAAVYGKEVPARYFEQKYDTAYAGVEFAGVIAYNTDQLPVAFYGVIPCLLTYKDELLLAAQSADTMTHPQHRYKGMFVDLSNRTFELCRQLGIRLIFGFPNQNSYHGAVNKLGWMMTERMSCFVITIRTLPLASLSNKIKLFEKIYGAYAKIILTNYSVKENGVANSVIADGFAGVHCSPEYLSYKKYSPSRVVLVAGAKIWISNKQGMWIGDLENVTDTNFSKVIRGLRKIAWWLGIKKIQFHGSPGTNLHRLFSANFPATPSYPVLFQDFGSPIRPEKIKFTFSDIDVF